MKVFFETQLRAVFHLTKLLNWVLAVFNKLLIDSKLKSVASFFESNRNTEQIGRHVKRFNQNFSSFRLKVQDGTIPLESIHHLSSLNLIVLIILTQRDVFLRRCRSIIDTIMIYLVAIFSRIKKKRFFSFGRSTWKEKLIRIPTNVGFNLKCMSSTWKSIASLTESRRNKFILELTVILMQSANSVASFRSS